MRYSDRKSTSKRPYSKISLKKREQLVKYVLQSGVSLSKAAKRIKIKLTTARLIVKRYRETGTFPMKKFKEQRRLPQEAVNDPCLSPQALPSENVSSERAICQMDKLESPPTFYANVHSSPLYPQSFFYYFWPLQTQEMLYF